MLVVASELKGILACVPELPRKIDPRALGAYLDLGYIPSPLSIFEAVRKLPPASLGVFDLRSRRLDVRGYWTLPRADEGMCSIEEAAEELDGLLRDAVRLRLQSDVPVGVFLSGGLDSGLVAALCAKEASDLETFTVTFPGSALDESQVASRVAEWIGLPNRRLAVQASVDSDLPLLAKQFDEPFADSSLIPTYLLSRATRACVKVALSGDGGDELFAGYDSYHRVMCETYLETIPSSARAVVGHLHRFIPVGTPGKNFLRRLALTPIERFLHLYSSPEDEGRSYLLPEWNRQARGYRGDRYRRETLERLTHSGSPLSLLQTMTRLDFGTYLPEDVLVKVDRASMFASLEVRSPLLDYRVAELAFRLPDRLRLHDGVRKVLLQRVAEKYLPPDFPFGRKRGFTIPEAEWFQRRWRGLLKANIASGSNLLDGDALEDLQARHQKTGRYGRMLFRALMLAFFEDNYVKP